MEGTKENKRKANHKIESKSTQILNFKVKKIGCESQKLL